MLEFNGTFIIAMLSFIVFIYIMNTILYRPILDIIRKRDNYIDTNYQDSKRFDIDAQDLTNIRTNKIKEAEHICRQEFKNAIEQSQSIADEHINTEKENIKAEIQIQKDKLEQDKNQLTTELRNSVVNNLADTILSKILNKESSEVAK